MGGILVGLRRLSIGEWHLEDVKLQHEVDYHMRGQVGSMKWGILEE